MARSYKLVTPNGTTSRRFATLLEAWRFLKPDSEDLEPRDLVRRTVMRPLMFADGFTFYRHDLRY